MSVITPSGICLGNSVILIKHGGGLDESLNDVSGCWLRMRTVTKVQTVDTPALSDAGRR